MIMNFPDWKGWINQTSTRKITHSNKFSQSAGQENSTTWNQHEVAMGNAKEVCS